MPLRDSCCTAEETLGRVSATYLPLHALSMMLLLRCASLASSWAWRPTTMCLRPRSPTRLSSQRMHSRVRGGAWVEV